MRRRLAPALLGARAVDADTATAGTALDDELRYVPRAIQKQPRAVSYAHASRIKQARVTFGTSQLRKLPV